MPYEDGTGPLGQGPMTGRGLGRCGGGLRRGVGYGRGYARGGRYQAPLTTTERKKILEEQLEELEAEKKDIESELKNLKTEKQSKD